MKKRGFFVELPPETIREIKRRKKAFGIYPWQVITHAIECTSGRELGTRFLGESCLGKTPEKWGHKRIIWPMNSAK